METVQLAVMLGLYNLARADYGLDPAAAERVVILFMNQMRAQYIIGFSETLVEFGQWMQLNPFS